MQNVGPPSILTHTPPYRPSSTACRPHSLHDALPIYRRFAAQGGDWGAFVTSVLGASHPDRLAGIHVNAGQAVRIDRKSTRLNSSHVKRSYDVFCLKKKKVQKFACP